MGYECICIACSCISRLSTIYFNCFRIGSMLACFTVFGKVDQSLFPRPGSVSEIQRSLYAPLEAVSRYHVLDFNQYSPEGKYSS